MSQSGILEVRVCDFAEDDALVLCTDGHTEAMDAAGSLCGLDRPSALLTAAKEDLRGAILADVTTFTESMGLQDDLMLLIIRR